MFIDSEDIPDSWVVETIENLCIFKPKHFRDLEDELEISFVPMAAVDAVTGTIQECEIRLLEKVRKGYTHFADGDVIFAKITPCMENGKCAVAIDLKNGLGCGSTEFHVLRSNGSIVAHFLQRYLRQQSYRDFAAQNMTGVVGQRRVSKQILLESPFPLPPLNEQRRIVTKIEELTAHSRKAREALDDVPALINQFRQSVLAAAFRGDLTADWREKNPDVEPAEKLLERIRIERRRRWEEACKLAKKEGQKKPKAPKENHEEIELEELSKTPSSWHWERLVNLSELLGGVTKGRKFNGRTTVHVPYLRVANVQDGFLNLVEIKEIEVLPDDIDKYRLEEGDILFTEGGDRDKLGRGTVWGDEIEGCIHQNHVYRARVYSNEILPEYISLAAKTEYSKNYFFENASQTVNLASINITTLGKLPIPIPPTAEQAIICDMVSYVFKVLESLQTTYQSVVDESDFLNQSILAKAFRGDLVPQDPNDEPASVLLKRIRTEREKLTATKKKGSTSRKKVKPDSSEQLSL